MKMLTDAVIKKLRPDAQGGTIERPDPTSPGLRIRVTPGGKRVWFYRYRHPATGKLQKLTLGHYPAMGLAAARRGWDEMATARRAGVDPRELVHQREAEAAALNQETQDTGAAEGFTVRSLVDQYLGAISKPGTATYRRSWADVRNTLNRTLVEKHGDRPAHELTRADVRDLLDALRSEGHDVAANRTLAAIRRLYNWAIEHEYPRAVPLTANPCAMLKTSREPARQRVLSGTELTTLFEKLPKTDLSLMEQRLLLLVLATGCRASEVTGMHWSEVHGTEWRISGHRTKNGKDHHVHLSPFARTLAGERPHKGGFVFPNRRADAGHIRTDRVSKQLQDALPVLTVERFTLHDLRRTMASWLGSQEVDDRIIDRMINHQPATLQRVYNVSRYDKPAAIAWNDWAAHLQSLQPAQHEPQGGPQLRVVS